MLGARAAPLTTPVAVNPPHAQSEEVERRELALRAFHDDLLRILRIAYPVLAEAHAICGDDVTYGVGIYALHPEFFPEKDRHSAAKVFGLGEGWTAIFVMPGSPAEIAGLRAPAMC